jgi:hypothetical protein
MFPSCLTSVLVTLMRKSVGFMSEGFKSIERMTWPSVPLISLMPEYQLSPQGFPQTRAFRHSQGEYMSAATAIITAASRKRGVK